MFGYYKSPRDKLIGELRREERKLYNHLLSLKLPKEISGILIITAALASNFINIYPHNFGETKILSSDYLELEDYHGLYQILVSYYIFTLLQQFKNSADLRDKLKINVDVLLKTIIDALDGNEILIPMLNQALKKEEEYEGNTMEVFGFFYFQALSMIIKGQRFNEMFEKIKDDPIAKMGIQLAVTINFGEYGKAVRKSLDLPEKLP